MKLFSRRIAARAAVCAAAAFGVSAASPAARAADERVEWNPEWPRFRKAEIAFTSGMALQLAAATFVYPQRTRRWEGGVLFDDAVRGSLRLESKSGRDSARRVADAMYYVLVAYPVVIDTALVTSGIHGSGDVALQILAMNLESYLFVAAVSQSIEKFGRVRPSAAECERDRDYSSACADEEELSQSIVSGHTSGAFVGAGLMCAHHTNLPLYGGGAADIAACVTALAAASAVGTLRVVSDDHHSTDVLLGAALGVFGGYGMPVLLHYGFGDDSAPSSSLLPTFRAGSNGAAMSAVLAPAAGPSGFGVALVGSF